MKYLLLDCSSSDEISSYVIQLKLTDDFKSMLRLRWALFNTAVWGGVEPPHAMVWLYNDFFVFEDGLGEVFPEDFDYELYDDVVDSEALVTDKPLCPSTQSIRIEAGTLRVFSTTYRQDAVLMFYPKHTDIRVVSCAITAEHLNL